MLDAHFISQDNLKVSGNCYAQWLGDQYNPHTEGEAISEFEVTCDNIYLKTDKMWKFQLNIIFFSPQEMDTVHFSMGKVGGLI